MQLCHAPLERFAFLCLSFLLIYCPDGAKIHLAPEVRHIIRTSLTKTKQLCHAPLERFILHCLTFLLIYCPDGARIRFAPEVRHIIRTSLTKTKQLCHAPLERFILHCLFFLLIYCPDGARITITLEDRYINNIISNRSNSLQRSDISIEKTKHMIGHLLQRSNTLINKLLFWRCDIIFLKSFVTLRWSVIFYIVLPFYRYIAPTGQEYTSLQR
jgi:hypothetical protein